jgi:branched-chain amino acid transport system permease protein
MSLYTPLTAKAGSPPRSQAWITRPMLLTLALLVSFPFWAEQVGLYQYLGIEIVIWMVYALGYNLLLGYTGLPAFGQGAFFGIGAYAYGICYLNFSQNPLLALACAARLPGRAPPRHLFRAAHHRLRPGLLVRRHEVALAHRR